MLTQNYKLQILTFLIIFISNFGIVLLNNLYVSFIEGTQKTSQIFNIILGTSDKCHINN